MTGMNRETRFEGSETLIVVDRPRRRRWLIVGILVAVAALAFATFMLRSGGEDAGNKRGGQVPSVTVIVPGETQVARAVTASGVLAARRDQPVGVAGEGGLVRAVLVDAGTWVRQGQLLASIDRSVQSQTAAQLAASIQVARADAALAQNEYDRSASLVGRGFVSKADLDRKKAARDAAYARVRVAQAQLGAARAQIGRLDIRAPASGLILSRDIEVGQIVSGGSGGLFRLAAGGAMEMRAKMSEQDTAAVRVGMTASITPVGSDRSFAGQVWQVSPIIDATSRLGEVRIALPYDPAIRPGGFAEARIVSGQTTAPVLPQSAVLSDSRGNYVYVVNAKNEVERRGIKTGSVTEVGVTIASGLSGQESVVLTAGPFLNPGQKIAPRRQAAR